MKFFPFIAIFVFASVSYAQPASNFIIVNKLALDIDGSPHAYHPNNEGTDYNSNGGINKTEATQNRFPLKGNRGYGIAKKLSGDKKYYTGFLTPEGYFVSQTTPYNHSKPDSVPEHYANAETIPYIAYSPGWKKLGVKPLDIAYVINLETGKAYAAIFTDYRNNDNETEISLALANALSIKVTTVLVKSYDGTKTVKKFDGIQFTKLKIFFFKGSGNGNGKTSEEIQKLGKKLMGITN
jgi:hypothetical protein